METTSRWVFGGAVCAGAMIFMEASTQAQNLFETDQGSGNVYEITPSGAESIFASGFSEPRALAFDSAGDLFVAGQSNGDIYEFKENNGMLDSTPTVFASGLSDPNSLAFNSAGDLFVGNVGNGSIYEFTPGGAQSTFATGLNTPEGIAFDSAGNLFVSSYSGSIYEITPSGGQSTFVSGLTTNPFGLAFNSAGDLFVGEGNGGVGIIEITPNGTQSTFVSGHYNELTFDSAGDLFVGQFFPSTSNSICEFVENDGTLGTSPIIVASGLNNPSGLAFEGETLPAPEPSVVALTATGIFALFIRRCRKN